MSNFWKREVPADDPLLAKYARVMTWLDNPAVIESHDGRLYFKPNRLNLWLVDKTPMGGGVSLQDMAIAQDRGQFSLREWAGFYVGLGYGLDSFVNIFADRIWPEGQDGRNQPDPGGSPAA